MDLITDILRFKDSDSSSGMDILRKATVTKSFRKGDILEYQGESSTKIYFVKKGVLRSYAIDEKGKEHIFMFASEGWIIADGADYNSVAELFIDVIEDSEVDIIDKKLFHKTIVPIQDLNERVISLIKRVSVLQRRVIMLMSASAIERYEHFVETYPDIVQRVPQKMIASYLGMTPEALSKVKGDKARRKS
ncbi:MAG: CRP-like cAMP-binding protein [Maribacter sp.]|jgi:CRP-like cAMP-binding protein